MMSYVKPQNILRKLQKSCLELMRAGHLPENLYSMAFDFAVEDSPAAFEHILHFEQCRVAVFDRPWNRQAEFPNDRFVRCKNWREVDGYLRDYIPVL